MSKPTSKVIKLKRNAILFLVFLFSFFTPLIQISQVSGINFTYTQYWFYVDQQGVIDYKDMYFTVQNTKDIPVEIVCSFRKIEGVNIDVILDWNRRNVSVGETVINNYMINVTGDYSATFNLEISLFEKPQGSDDSKLAGAGTVINKVVFYSSEEGSLLSLKIADQADTPREAEVFIRYSYNDSMPYTPIKEFNGSSFYGVLPYGDYMVQAYDLESGVYAEQFFTLNSTEYNVTVNLALVGFGMFKLLPRGVVGVNATIFNHVGEIDDVKIYAELYLKNNNELIETSEAWYISPLPRTTNQKLSLWFKYTNWIPEQKYVVRGVIEAGGLPIAYRLSDDFGITINKETPTIRFETAALMGLVGGVVIYYAVSRYLKIQEKKKES